MKKLAVIAVLTLFLVNTMGYYAVFRYNQYLLQQEMIARIRGGQFHDKVITLRIFHPEKEKQFRRLNKSEFSYHGNLYDEVGERTCGDTTFFYCLHDKKEETLLANYMLYLKYSGGSSHKNKPVPAFLNSLITQALIQQPSQPFQRQGVTFHYPVSSRVLIPVYREISAPPPESA